MTPRLKIETPDLCARCGHPKESHWVLNHANGPYVSGDVLICPTAVYRPSASNG